MCNNCNSCNPCNNGVPWGSNGFFQNDQFFWVVVIIALILIWVHYCNNGYCGGYGCGNNCCGCGCEGYEPNSCC